MTDDLDAEAQAILDSMVARRYTEDSDDLDDLDQDALSWLVKAAREVDSVIEAYEAGDANAFEKAGMVDVTGLSREELKGFLLGANRACSDARCG